MSIYTKKGDGGEAGLPGDRRLPKSERVFELLGNLDETSAALAVVVSEIEQIVIGRKKTPREDWQRLGDMLISVQEDLLLIGSVVASPATHTLLEVLTKRVHELEKLIDEWDIQLSRLANFVIPGGNMTASSLHLARAIARRTEREYHRLPATNVHIAQYLNRLSDLLFQAARFSNHLANKPDRIWRKLEN